MDAYANGALRFPVVDGGPADGEPVVLLHGFPQGPAAYADVTRRLHVAGLRTLVPTMRGYAPTARPRGRRAYRTTQTVGDLLALLDTAGLPRVHVVGHDWGAAPAWATAAWHPDRVASLTVLSTPHPAAMLASLVRSDQGLRSWYMGFFQLPRLPEWAARRTLARTLADSGLPEPQLSAYVAAMSDRSALTGALNWYRGLPFSAQPAVGPVAVPTTYVWGRHDFALGRVAAERTARHVHARYDFVELDGGHWLPETEPEAVAAAILQQVRPSPVGPAA